jgi:hypothetical protein
VITSTRLFASTLGAAPSMSSRIVGGMRVLMAEPALTVPVVPAAGSGVEPLA